MLCFSAVLFCISLLYFCCVSLLCLCCISLLCLCCISLVWLCCISLLCLRCISLVCFVVFLCCSFLHYWGSTSREVTAPSSRRLTSSSSSSPTAQSFVGCPLKVFFFCKHFINTKTSQTNISLPEHLSSDVFHFFLPSVKNSRLMDLKVGATRQVHLVWFAILVIRMRRDVHTGQ